LDSDPDSTPVDWDRSETLGKVRADKDQVISKDLLATKGIIYSKDGSFPIMNPATYEPPAALQWQKTRLHGLLISGESLWIKAVDSAIRKGTPNARERESTFEKAKREAEANHPEGGGERTRISTGAVWIARTALFLVRLFATAIG